MLDNSYYSYYVRHIILSVLSLIFHLTYIMSHISLYRIMSEISHYPYYVRYIIFPILWWIIHITRIIVWDISGLKYGRVDCMPIWQYFSHIGTTGDWYRMAMCSWISQFKNWTRTARSAGVRLTHRSVAAPDPAILYILLQQITSEKI